MTVAETHPVRAPSDILGIAHDMLVRGRAVALATVASTWGSAPVPVGGQMLVIDEDTFAGSVSGGCVENDVIIQALDAIGSGQPRMLEFGVADETAWRAGLPCGGQIKILIEPLSPQTDLDDVKRLLDAAVNRKAMVAVTHIGGGRRSVFETGQDPPAQVAEAVAECFASRQSRLIETTQGSIFLAAQAPAVRVIIIGASHAAQHLAALAHLTGYPCTVIDPRTAYAAPERFPQAQIVAEWPRDCLPRLALDRWTAVVALSHVPDIDDGALIEALRSPSFYVGALGSRKNHAARIKRLAGAGATGDDTARIHSPVGLDIGARTPAEIALSIMAEIVLAARGKKHP